MRVVLGALFFAGAFALASCGGREEPVPEPESIPAEEVAPVDPPPEVVIPERPRELDEDGHDIRPANLLDESYGATGPVRVRRLVYRFQFRPHFGVGTPNPAIPAPVGELRLDVGAERLRARFVGPGWPVVAGSEVRLRRDAPGAYVFDGDGGRPLGPGGLAGWFQGGPPPRDAHLVIRRAEPDDVAIASMVCRFLAEWANGSVDRLVRSCADELPTTLVLGPYLATLTGDAEVTLTQREMRADHESPPPPLEPTRFRTFVTSAQLAQLRPDHDPPDNEPRLPPDAEVPSEGLRVRNRGVVRLVITVDGTPIAWLDSGQSATFTGMPPGYYVVAAMKPLGGIGAAPRVMRLPGFALMPIR